MASDAGPGATSRRCDVRTNHPPQTPVRVSRLVGPLHCRFQAYTAAYVMGAVVGRRYSSLITFWYRSTVVAKGIGSSVLRISNGNGSSTCFSLSGAYISQCTCSYRHG